MNRNTTSCAGEKDIRMNPNKNVHAKGPKFGRVGNFYFTRRSFFSDVEFLTPHTDSSFTGNAVLVSHQHIVPGITMCGAIPQDNCWYNK